MKPRIVYMGTPAFAVPTLEALLQAGYPVVGVVCQPDKPAGRGQKLTPPPVKDLATASGIPVYQPERVRQNPEFLETLRALAPDLVVVVAYGKILPAEILDLPRFGCLNVHASLLPAYRGAAPIQWAVIQGETMTGVTLMKMDLGMDTGDMLAKAELPIAPDDTALTLAPKLASLGAELAVERIPDWVAGRLAPEPQVHAHASMAPMLSKETGRLDWERPAMVLHNLVRGVQPWPGATTTLAGEPLKVVVTRVVVAEAPAGAPGEIVALTPDGWVVACGEDALLLAHVQAPGKPPQQAADVARGRRDVALGVRLGQPAEAARV